MIKGDFPTWYDDYSSIYSLGYRAIANPTTLGHQWTVNRYFTNNV